MKSKASILIALFLFSSVFAEESFQYVTKDQNGLTGGEPKHTTTIGGAYGGGSGGSTGGGIGGGPGGGLGDGIGAGGGSGGHSMGFGHGGVYGGGQFCKFGCCNKSFGYSHKGGGYYSCTCCATAAEAEAYKESQAKAQIKN